MKISSQVFTPLDQSIQRKALNTLETESCEIMDWCKVAYPPIFHVCDIMFAFFAILAKILNLYFITSNLVQRDLATAANIVEHKWKVYEHMYSSLKGLVICNLGYSSLTRKTKIWIVIHFLHSMGSMNME